MCQGLKCFRFKLICWRTERESIGIIVNYNHFNSRTCTTQAKLLAWSESSQPQQVQMVNDQVKRRQHAAGSDKCHSSQVYKVHPQNVLLLPTSVLVWITLLLDSYVLLRVEIHSSSVKVPPTRSSRNTYPISYRNHASMACNGMFFWIW